MKQPRFSIIIPAHNSANYITKGLDSIASQSYKNYEIIVVCDNCSDNTQKVAESYHAITDTVHFGRDGLTRDHGITLAKGDYILFLDDDDWFLHEFCFQQLADKLSADPVDMLAFGIIFRTKGYYPPSPDRYFTPRISHVWAKAWKRDIIGNAHFGDAVFSSDTYFLRDMKHNVRTTAELNMPIYYYNFLREGSQTDLFCKGKLKQSPVAE